MNKESLSHFSQNLSKFVRDERGSASADGVSLVGTGLIMISIGVSGLHQMATDSSNISFLQLPVGEQETAIQLTLLECAGIGLGLLGVARLNGFGRSDGK